MPLHSILLDPVVALNNRGTTVSVVALKDRGTTVSVVALWGYNRGRSCRGSTARRSGSAAR